MHSGILDKILTLQILIKIPNGSFSMCVEFACWPKIFFNSNSNIFVFTIFFLMFNCWRNFGKQLPSSVLFMSLSSPRVGLHRTLCKLSFNLILFHQKFANIFCRIANSKAAIIYCTAWNKNFVITQYTDVTAYISTAFFFKLKSLFYLKSCYISLV